MQWREAELETWWEWQVRERAEIYLLPLPSRVALMVYSSLELMRVQTQPPNCGFTWLWAKMEAQDEEKFTFKLDLLEGPP